MTTLVMASRARVAGEPMSGITKNGSTNVATCARRVHGDQRARRRPLGAALVAQQGGGGGEGDAHHDGRRQDDDRGGPREVAQRLGERRRLAVMNGSVGVARITAPRRTRAAVSSWATAIRPTTDFTRGRTNPSRIAPIAIPIRNRTRMIVNT